MFDDPFGLGTVDGLVRLLQHSAAFDDGEAVNQLTHALQCAALLHASAPEDGQLQVAGLVHDIGHVLAPGDDAAHPTVGAEAIEPLLGPRVGYLVRHHVDAKRYLVATDPRYRDQLSPRSTSTLAAQGGPLRADACLAFEASKDLGAVVALRRADDVAKMPDVVVPDLDAWLPTLHAVANAAH